MGADDDSADARPGLGEVDGGRPQDQGRKHRRARNPSPETRTLLARAQQAMRDDLSAILDELQPQLPDPGLGLDPDTARPARLPVKDRKPRWDLAILLMRELGTEVDPAGGVGGDPGSAAPTAPRKWARRRVDYGND